MYELQLGHSARRYLPSSIVALILLLGLVVPAHAQNNQPYYPIDSVNPASQTYGSSAYPLQLFDSIDLEAAQRWYEQCPGNQVSVTANASACLGTAGAGLTMTPAACVAYNEGLRMTETGSIVFPNSSTCWVAVDPNTSGTNAGLPNFGRVAGTHYLTDCIDVSAPSMPANAQLLMKVVTSGGAITGVTDERTVKAACGGGAAGGVTQLLAGAGISLTPTNGQGTVTVTNTNLAGAPINLLPPQTGDYNAQFFDFTNIDQLFASEIVDASVNGVLNPMAPQVLVAGTTNTYLTAGAKCDGATDDYAALQNTIFAACGMTNISSSPVTNVASVYIPYTGQACVHSAPLRIPCAAFNIYGDENSIYPDSGLAQSYDGATFNIQAYQLSNLLFDSNIGLTGNSLHLTNQVQRSQYISLDDYLNTPKLNLNGQTSIDIQGIDRRSALGSNFANNDYFYDGGPSGGVVNSNNTSVKVYINYGSGSANSIQASFTTATSGVVTITGPTGIAANTNYYWHAQKNGNNCALFVAINSGASTEYGPTTCTGALVQTIWEQANIPAQGESAYWPDRANLNNSVQNGATGDNAFIWVSNISRSDTGYPSTKPPVDSNTELLCNWANTQAIDGMQRCENGTHGTDIPVWFNVKIGGGQSTAQLNGGRLHSLNLNMNPAGGYQGAGDAVYASWGSNEEFDHLYAQHCSAYGINVNTYSDYIHDNSLGGNSDFCRASLVINFNNQMAARNQLWGWVGVADYNLSNLTDEQEQYAPGGVGYIPILNEQSTILELGLNVDNEQSDANMLAAAYYGTGSGTGGVSEIINAQQLNSGNNAPMVVQNGADPVRISGGTFSKNSQSPSEVIDIVGTPPSTPDIVEGLGLTNASGIALTNVPNSVISIGNSGSISKSGTAGTAVCTQATAGPGGRTDCVLAGYANTGAAQTVTFPQAYQQVPNMIPAAGSTSPCAYTTGLAVSATTLTLMSGSATADTCQISVFGG